MVALETIPLLTNEPETAKAVAAALNLPAGSLQVYQDVPQFIARLEQMSVRAALVDIDPLPSDTLGDLEPVISRFEHTRFVVLSRAHNTDVVLEAMRAGVRHFLRKQSLEDELPDVLRRLAAQGASHRPEREGAVVTILSAGGGCGATTFAINLANELRLQSREPVLLVDLDVAYGAIAGALGLSGQYGIADVLTPTVDPQLVQTTAVRHSDDLHALLSPVSVNAQHPAHLELDHLERVLESCAQAYGWSVVDAPRVESDAAAALALGSCITFIAGQLSVKDVRIARTIRQGLLDRNVPADTIVPVAMRYRKRDPMVTLEEARQTLCVPTIQVVSNDFRRAIEGINFGQLLARSAPRSGLRHDMQKLATLARNAKSTVAATC